MGHSNLWTRITLMLFFNIESCLFPQDFEGCFLLWQNETVFLPPGQVLKALSSYIIHHTTFSNCTLPLRLGIQTEAADPHPCRSLWFAKRHLGRCWCSDAQRRGSQWQISMWWPQFVGGVENQSRVSFGFFLGGLGITHGHRSIWFEGLWLWDVYHFMMMIM